MISQFKCIDPKYLTELMIIFFLMQLQWTADKLYKHFIYFNIWELLVVPLWEQHFILALKIPFCCCFAINFQIFAINMWLAPFLCNLLTLLAYCSWLSSVCPNYSSLFPNISPSLLHPIHPSFSSLVSRVMWLEKSHLLLLINY